MSNTIGKREFSSISISGESISINIDESGKIFFVSTNLYQKEPVRRKIEGNPHEDTIVDMKKIFCSLMKNNLDMFKEVLIAIKDSEAEYYSTGVELLKKKKEEILLEAEKYSL